MRDPWLVHDDLDVIAKSGTLKDDAVVLDLKDYERALVWIDSRFARVLGPGQYAVWKSVRDIRYEIVDARQVRFEHPDINVIMKSENVFTELNPSFVQEGHTGVLFKDGEYVDTFSPGQYLFWNNVGKIKFYHVDMREIVLDVSGQEIMTSDKVTLRMNAVVNYQVVDAHKSITTVDDSRQAIYREAQLALRAVVGTYDLDTLLADKDKAAQDLEDVIRQRVAEFGLKVISLGIRDVILPGEMKELMNKVIEAKKKADANLIMRREETAAMRSQANTAKIMENNPTLMRLRELDVLEKIAEKSELNVVLGEKGLADRIVNML
ncbi:MAG: slipin family protein [Desulfobacterales bacterium]|nr:slipin family protein [Desulfobacterales bacterium]